MSFGHFKIIKTIEFLKYSIFILQYSITCKEIEAVYWHKMLKNNLAGGFRMEQKEVAKRITAEPGSKEYGTLSIVMAATGNVELLKV